MPERGETPRVTRPACRHALEAAGFRKRAGDIYTLEVGGDEVVGRVALGTAANRPAGPFEVYPVVGVHHREVERVRADLMASRASTYDPATVASIVGYLTPQHSYRAWYFTADTDVDAEAADLAAVVTEHGVPFMRGRTSLAAIIDDLEHLRHGGRESAKKRLPIAYELAGRPDPARAHLDASVADVEGHTDLAAVEHRAFAERFRRRFGR